MIVMRRLHLTLISINQEASAVGNAMMGNVKFRDSLHRTNSTLNFLHCSLAAALENNKYDYLITPGNSFGEMSGGFDKAVADIYGQSLEVRVRALIATDYLGEMNVGQATVFEAGSALPALVYAPTMRVPRTLSRYSEACYLAALAAMHAIEKSERVARRKELIRILLPLLGRGTGRLDLEVIANQTATAISRLMDPVKCDGLFTDGADWDAIVSHGAVIESAGGRGW